MARHDSTVDRSLRVDPDLLVPLYHQLKEQLRGLARTLEPGSLMPSETEIIRHSGVSRATVRKAVSDLVQEGLLQSQRGRGTFIAAQRFEASLERPAGFTETMVRLGHVPSAEVLAAEMLPASPEIGELLGIRAGDEIVMLERIRIMDGEPCMVERTHLPAHVVPGILALDIRGSLYDLIRAEYGLVPARGTETIIAVNADRHLAQILRVPIATALLATSRRTESQRGAPLEYTLRHARGDLCSFRVALADGSTLSDRAVADSAFPASGF